LPKKLRWLSSSIPRVRVLSENSSCSRRNERRALAAERRNERAELARLRGDDTARQREFREAHRLFLEIGAPIRAAEVARMLE
jgi:hypothetical protein